MTIALHTLGMPDLHDEQPALDLPIKMVGHRGVDRVLLLGTPPVPAHVRLNVSVGLGAGQRGAHMSRLIDCLPAAAAPGQNLADWMVDALDRLQAATPTSTNWHLDARTTAVLALPDGLKPVNEIVSLTRTGEAETRFEWGLAAKVALACPQAQAVIAHDRAADTRAEHPSHNQICDLTLECIFDHLPGTLPFTLVGLLAEVESAASAPVRERQKRRGEADVVVALHENARFAEDALRRLASVVRSRVSDALCVRASIVNYESIFEYPLECVVEA